MKDSLRVAIEGCCHGELSRIYEVIQRSEQDSGTPVDLVLLCGDLQCARHPGDLESMAVPPKFRNLGDFHEYYEGKRKIPIPTIAVSGNHECSNYLMEFPYGGFLCEDFFYMGYGAVLQVLLGDSRFLRIGGISGIYKKHDYGRARHECVPLNDSTMRSVYHQRRWTVDQLSTFPQDQYPIDVFLSHDWPQGVTRYGNTERLVRQKPYFAAEIAQNHALGSPPLWKLMCALKPSYWFSAHLHCKYPAIVPHDDGASTKFLALDKCLPQRDFLQFVDIPLHACAGVEVGSEQDEEARESSADALSIQWDPIWLDVVKGTAESVPFGPSHSVARSQLDDWWASIERTRSQVANQPSRTRPVPITPFGGVTQTTSQGAEHTGDDGASTTNAINSGGSDDADRTGQSSVDEAFDISHVAKSYLDYCTGKTRHAPRSYTHKRKADEVVGADTSTSTPRDGASAGPVVADANAIDLDCLSDD